MPGYQTFEKQTKQNKPLGPYLHSPAPFPRKRRRQAVFVHPLPSDQAPLGAHFYNTLDLCLVALKHSCNDILTRLMFNCTSRLKIHEDRDTGLFCCWFYLQHPVHKKEYMNILHDYELVVLYHAKILIIETLSGNHENLHKDKKYSKFQNKKLLTST